MKTKFNRYAALFFTLCTVLLVITGCNNIFEPLPTIVKGKSVLILNVSDNSPFGRTIKPEGITFDEYDVKIFTHGADLEDPDVEPLIDDTFSPGAPIVIDTLGNGDYDIYVDGLMNSVVIAKGHVLNVQLRPGSPTQGMITIPIELAPLMEGTGTFSWNLTYDRSYLKSGEMVVQTPDGDVVVLTGTSGDHDFIRDILDTQTGDHGSETLDAGEYEVVFTLGFGDTQVEETVIWTERLHIYKNLDSPFVFEFIDLRASTLEKELERRIREKTPGQAPAGVVWQHFDLLDIEGLDENDFATAMNAIVWVKDLKTSVDIAILKIIPNTSWDTYFHSEVEIANALNTHTRNGLVIADSEVEVLFTDTSVYAEITLFEGTPDEHKFDITGFSYPWDHFTITVANLPVGGMIAEGTNTTVRQFHNGFTSIKTTGNQTSYVQFAVDFGTHKLSAFERLTFTYTPIQGDTNYKKFFLLASKTAFDGDLTMGENNTAPASTVAAAVTSLTADNALHLYNGSPNFSSGNVTLYINNPRAVALDPAAEGFTENVIHFIIYSHMGDTAQYDLSNINFIVGALCAECGNFPCTCEEYVHGTMEFGLNSATHNKPLISGGTPDERTGYVTLSSGIWYYTFPGGFNYAEYDVMTINYTATYTEGTPETNLKSGAGVYSPGIGAGTNNFQTFAASGTEGAFIINVAGFDFTGRTPGVSCQVWPEGTAYSILVNSIVFTKTAPAISAISITDPHTLTYYQYYSESVDLSGLVVTGTFGSSDRVLAAGEFTVTYDDDGTEKSYTEFNFDLPGTYEFTVTSTENSTLKETFEIEVIELTALEVSGSYRTDYYQYFDNELSYTGLVVRRVYDDTFVAPIPLEAGTDYDIDHAIDFSSSGSKTVTVAYKHNGTPIAAIKDEFTVNVIGVTGITAVDSIFEVQEGTTVNEAYILAQIAAGKIIVRANYPAPHESIVIPANDARFTAVVTGTTTFTVTITWNTSYTAASFELAVVTAPSFVGYEVNIAYVLTQLKPLYQYVTDLTITDLINAGLVIQEKYSSGDNVDVDEHLFVVEDYNKHNSGTQTITVSTTAGQASFFTMQVNTYALSGITITGIPRVFRGTPTEAEILAAMNANVYFITSAPEVEPPVSVSHIIKGNLETPELNLTEDDIVVNSDGRDGGTITVNWKAGGDTTVSSYGPHAYTYAIDQGLHITLAQLTDITITEFNLSTISLAALAVTPITVTVPEGQRIDWYLNGVHQSTEPVINQHTFDITAKNSKIGKNVLRVEVTINGRLYIKNVVYTVGL